MSFDNNAPARAGREKASIGQQILVVEDDEITRSTLLAMLEHGGHCGVEAADFEQTKTALRNHTFRLAMIDLVFADHDYCGFDITHYIRAIQPDCAIVIITSSPSTDSAVTALRIKATDYLTKPIRKAALLHTVETVIGPMTAAAQQGPDNDPLSTREREVLFMLYKGLSYREIADALACSVATAKTYGRRAYCKLGVSTRAEAVYEALQQGLVSE